jgi:intermediate cleaving peptidase 55
MHLLRPHAFPRARLLLNPALRSRAQACRCYAATAEVSEVDAKDLSFGQPVYETHKHILQPGEGTRHPRPRWYHGCAKRSLETVTPGITALEYAYRRASLAALLPKNSVAIVAAATTKYRSGPVFYRFHQDPNFFYLTGMLRPRLAALG